MRERRKITFNNVFPIAIKRFGRAKKEKKKKEGRVLKEGVKIIDYVNMKKMLNINFFTVAIINSQSNQMRNDAALFFIII